MQSPSLAGYSIETCCSSAHCKIRVWDVNVHQAGVQHQTSSHKDTSLQAVVSLSPLRIWAGHILRPDWICQDQRLILQRRQGTAGNPSFTCGVEANPMFTPALTPFDYTLNPLKPFLCNKLLL